jgi:hypothetical protein
VLAFSQGRSIDSLPKNIDEYILVKPGDSVVIQLNEITLLPKPKFSSKNDIRYYLWFRKKVYKAYPFAKLASERLDSLNARLERIDSKSNRRNKIIPNRIGTTTDILPAIEVTDTPFF